VPKKLNVKTAEKTIVPEDYKIGLITCSKHGRLPGGLVCKHLKHGGLGLGFYLGEDTDDQFSGWCYECEQVLENGAEWDDPGMSDHLTLVCRACFMQIEADNRVRIERPLSKMKVKPEMTEVRVLH
jgi:hypothetical protein